MCFPPLSAQRARVKFTQDHPWEVNRRGGLSILLAAFLDNPFQLVGFCRRECTGRAIENRLALFLADPLEPVDEVGGHFQPGRRQRLQVLDDVFERAQRP